MNHDRYPDAYLREILQESRTVAVVGASADPARPSHYVMAYLQSRGYRTIPVNPSLAGGRLLGELAYASLTDIPVAVDLVDIIRRSEDAGVVVDEAIGIGAKTVWMQSGIRDDAAAARAEAAGLKAVMDRCTKIEHGRLDVSA